MAEIAESFHAIRARRYDDIVDSQGLLRTALIARIARGRRHGLPDVAHTQRGAVAIGQDHVIERFGFGELVVGRDREADCVGKDRSFGGVARGLDQFLPDLLKSEPDRSKLGRIDLNADRWFLVSDNRGLRDAWHLRQRLDEERGQVPGPPDRAEDQRSSQRRPAAE